MPLQEPTFQKIPPFSCQGYLLPIHSPTLWSINGPKGVHYCSKGGQTDSSARGYTNPPVPRRLVGKGHYSQRLSRTNPQTGSLVSRLRVDSESRKIRTGTETSLRLCRLPVRSEGGQGPTHSREVANPAGEGPRPLVGPPLQGPTTHVSDRSFDSYRKTGALGSSAHETYTVAPKESLENTGVTRKGDTGTKISAPSSKLVASEGKCPLGSATSSTQPLATNLHRCVRGGLGCTLRGSDSKGLLVSSREQVAHKLFRAKSCVPGSKRISRSLLRKVSSGSDRQHHSRCLHKQGRRHEVRPAVCPPMENPDLVQQGKDNSQGSTHPWSPECSSRQTVQVGSDHPDRVVPSPRGVQVDLQPVVSPGDRPICNQVQPQTTSVCVSSTGPTGLGSGCPEPSVGRFRPIRLPTDSHFRESGVQAQGPPMQEDHSDSPRVAQNALVLGLSGHVQSGSIVSTTCARPTDTTIQPDPSQRPSKPQSPCMALRATAIKERGFSEAVAARIEAPQRVSTRSVYDAKWTIFTEWCKDHKVDFRSPPITSIAEFLLYLFEERRLQPSTIDGYRSAIADKVGNSPISISKNEDLNRLLDSFHRDRPKGRRGIPSWNLSLVLHQLTKAPFEPMKEASLKHLTFKTVFLLALGSGKRRSEIHAWVKRNIRYQRDWSNVSLYPSASFLSKNQLAREGPDSVAPVVIPALAPTLDRSCTEDRSLCPVRALRYYLDRTNDLRQGKELVFVSFKKGFDKDISPATISSWIKQTVILCYELSDKEAQTLHQVKAHDVRAFAASKAFHSGASLEQLLSACHWKSHNTFTQFYLKDVAWADAELFHLGPVVAAQQIHK